MRKDPQVAVLGAGARLVVRPPSWASVVHGALGGPRRIRQGSSQPRQRRGPGGQPYALADGPSQTRRGALLSVVRGAFGRADGRVRPAVGPSRCSRIATPWEPRRARAAEAARHEERDGASTRCRRDDPPLPVFDFAEAIVSATYGGMRISHRPESRGRVSSARPAATSSRLPSSRRSRSAGRGRERRTGSASSR